MRLPQTAYVLQNQSGSITLEWRFVYEWVLHCSLFWLNTTCGNACIIYLFEKQQEDGRAVINFGMKPVNPSAWLYLQVTPLHQNTPSISCLGIPQKRRMGTQRHAPY